MANVVGRPIAALVLSRDERAYLKRQARGRRVARSLSERCRAILRCADGIASKSVANELGIHEHTVGKWRRRFLKDRIEGLLDEARPGRPRTIDDDQIAAVIERTLRSTPEDSTHWSIRSMATASGYSHTTIRRILDCLWSAATSLAELQTFQRPAVRGQSSRHRRSLFVTAKSGAGAQCRRESQIQALDREQPVLPMMPGIPERRTHSYVRHGTTSLFAALDVASGFVIGKCYKRHRASEFLNFLKQIDAHVPHSLDVHIIMDNYATHKTAVIRSWLARRPHYHVHFTPTSASWINQVERWFAELTRKQLRRGVHTSTKQLEADIRAFIARHNEKPKPYRWTKSADDILASVRRHCRAR